jgi:hypothetical protein
MKVFFFFLFPFCEVGGLATCNNLWCKYGNFNISSSKYDDFVHFLTMETKGWLNNCFWAKPHHKGVEGRKPHHKAREKSMTTLIQNLDTDNNAGCNF